MSKARRDTKCLRCSVFWNGQANSPEQRKRTPSSPAALISRTTGVFSGHGQVLGNAYSFAPFGRFSEHDTEHLRDHVAGALDRHRVADAHVEPRDLVGIVQRRVLHHHAADRDRLELRDRRERAGAADLDLDVAQHRGRLLGRELVRDRPARVARHETRAAPASRAGRPCRRRRRCRSRARRASARSRDGTRAAPRPTGTASISGLVCEAAARRATSPCRTACRPASRSSRPTHRRRSAAAATP